jgi:hypothetical protein
VWADLLLCLTVATLSKLGICGWLMIRRKSLELGLAIQGIWLGVTLGLLSFSSFERFLLVGKGAARSESP